MPNFLRLIRGGSDGARLIQSRRYKRVIADRLHHQYHRRASNFGFSDYNSHSKRSSILKLKTATVVDANTQPDRKAVAPLPERPNPFDAIVGYERRPPGTAYPRGPRKVQHLGTIEWNWGYLHERVSPYFLHRARRHWLLWTKVPDEWEKPQWMPCGYAPLAQATREEAAFHLVTDLLRFERDHAKLDRFEAVTSVGYLSRNEWDSIARAIWSPVTTPPIKDRSPYTAWLPVPQGEEQRVVMVLAALHDSAFRWEEVDRADSRSYARALSSVDKDTATAIRGDSDAVDLLAFLARGLGNHDAGFRSRSGVKLPSAHYTIAPHGGVTFNSEEKSHGAVSFGVKLSLALPWYFERKWTPKAEERLRAYLARPDYIIPRGTGTREAASSMAAIYMALTGELSNRPPECMSYVIGRWIELLQDEIPHEIRNDAAWRELLALAARIDRKHDSERLDILVSWVWETVLPTLESVADKYDVGKSWSRAVVVRSVRSATSAAKAIESALAYLGEDVFLAHHDDDLGHLNHAADAARAVAVASDKRRLGGTTTDAKGIIDAALKATVAANNAGVSWQTLDPVAVLKKMIDA